MTCDAGHLVLDAIGTLLVRCLVLPSADACAAVVLWIVHAHGVEAFRSTSRLALVSPEKVSGKMRALEVIALNVTVSRAGPPNTQTSSETPGPGCQPESPTAPTMSGSP